MRVSDKCYDNQGRIAPLFLTLHPVLFVRQVRNDGKIKKDERTYHVTGERVVLDHDLVSMLSRSIEGTEHEVQVDGQAVHNDDF